MTKKHLSRIVKIINEGLTLITERLKQWHKSRATEGDSDDFSIGEPEFFLPPLLATDPIAYLVDGDGRLVDAKEELITTRERLNEVHSPGMQRLIIETMGVSSIEELLPATPQ